MASTRKAALATYRNHLGEADALIEIAEIYRDDGAFLTAASRLDAAAAHLRQADAIKLQALAGMVQQTGEVAHG